ncbi:MAG: conjugal transfer protein TraO [Bacteroidales bacterium]|nr:conjugal transfer protein TraO [Bacteroidales bacterium]
MTRTLLALILPLILVTLHPASAQRTAVGSSQVTLSCGTTLSHLGAEASYGAYLLRGYWMGGVAFHNRVERDSPSLERVFYPRLELRGGYMHRLLSSYSRSVSLYLGAEAFVGVELLDLYGTLSGPTRSSLLGSGLREVQFIYGAAPRADLELFVSARLAIILSARMPLAFGSPLPLLGWELSGGLRLNL